MAGKYYREELVAGLIVADAEVQWGEPCIVGTRIPFCATWVGEYLDKPQMLEELRITRDMALALIAFEAGYEWHRQRKRRWAMDAAVDRVWADFRQMEGDSASRLEGEAMNKEAAKLLEGKK